MRLRSLDSGHPLVHRACPAAVPRRGPKKTANSIETLEGKRALRLQRLAALARPCPRPLLLPKRWSPLPSPGKAEPALQRRWWPGLGKDVAVLQHRCWLSTLTKEDLVVYTNGSQVTVKGAARTDWGFVAWHAGGIFYRHHGHLEDAEVSDAKVKAAREAARWVVRPESVLPPFDRFHFCLDNTAIVHGLMVHRMDNS